MELNSQVNTFANGMNMDADVTMIPEGQYRYAENIRLITDADGTTGALQNIEYIRQYSKGIPTDETILGTAVTRIDEGTECGIVFTKKGSDDNPYNTLYKVTNFDSIDIESSVITKGYLGISKKNL